MDSTLKNKLDQFKKGTLSGKEKVDILSLFHEEAKEYELKDELYQELTRIGEETTDEDRNYSGNFNHLWARIKSQESNRFQRIRKIHPALKYWSAAILIIGLLVANLISHNQSSAKLYYTVKAPQGSIAEQILPDGTLIFLNSGSQLKYLVGVENYRREVILDGEAWFHVQKSEEVPFVVHTSCYDVKVMGTKFNVKAYGDDPFVSTTLEEGSILVQSTEQFRLKQDIQLKPGEQLVYDKTKRSLQLTPVNSKLFTSWKDNKLIFINMNFRELIVLLERKYGVEIVVNDQDIFNYHYDGTIKDETILEVLNILQTTLSIHYTIKDQKIYITKK